MMRSRTTGPSLSPPRGVVLLPNLASDALKSVVASEFGMPL
jgi:hypothetical protein